MDISFKITPRILKNTERLVRLYNTNLHFREQFDALLDRPRMTFQGQPLVVYAWVIYKISPRYYSQVKEVWESQENIKDLLVDYYHDRRGLGNLDTRIQELGKTEAPIQKEIIAPDKGIMATAAQIEKTPEGDPQKVQLIDKVRQQINEDLKTPPETQSQPQETEPLQVQVTKEEPRVAQAISQSPVSKEPEIITAEPAPVIPEKFTPIVLPKTEDKPKEIIAKKQAEIKIITPIPESIKLTPEQPNAEPAKDTEITEENGIPQWTSPKTGKRYPLKVAGGSETTAAPMQRPQIKEDLGQKVSALKRLNLPYPVQNFAKNTISFGSRLIIRNTPTVISATIGGFVGGALAGPTGIPAGLIGGGLFPKVIKSGILQKGATASVAKGAGKLALKGAIGLSNPIGWAWLALSAPGVKTAVKYAVVAFLAIFALPVLMNLNKSQSLFPPYDTAYSAPIDPPGTGGIGGSGGNIASCQFTYQGKKVSILSNTLKNLINEVAGKTGVPASVLAGTAVHESPTFTQTAADSHDAFFNRNFSGVDCMPHFPTSDTGALGLMQVQTPENLKPQLAKNYNPAAVSIDGLKNGLGFLGRDLTSLTTQDFCGVKTNLYLGAGILISKNGGKPPTTPDQVKNAVCSYYGQCSYGGYNYGDEVANDFTSCKPPPSPPPQPTYTASCPVPNGEITCASYGKPYSGTGVGAWTANCAVDRTGYGGHCNENYKTEVGICNKTVGDNGQLIRTAKSIDITAVGGNKANDPVYLPTIKGETLKWYFKGDVYAGAGFGWIRLFQSEATPEGIWSIHLVHANEDSPHFNLNQPIGVNQAAATMFNLGRGTHIHVTVGLNIGDSKTDLQNYNSNWKFADRDLGMCVK